MFVDNYFEREPVIVCSNSPVEIGYVAELIAKKFNIEIEERLKQTGFKNCKYIEKLQAIICEK